MDKRRPRIMAAAPGASLFFLSFSSLPRARPLVARAALHASPRARTRVGASARVRPCVSPGRGRWAAQCRRVAVARPRVRRASPAAPPQPRRSMARRPSTPSRSPRTCWPAVSLARCVVRARDVLAQPRPSCPRRCSPRARARARGLRRGVRARRGAVRRATRALRMPARLALRAREWWCVCVCVCVRARRLGAHAGPHDAVDRSPRPSRRPSSA